MYRLSESSLGTVTDWIASNKDQSVRERLLAWLSDFAEHPGSTPFLRVPEVERVQAYLVPGTDVVVAAIIDESHGLIDVVEVETLQEGLRR